MTATTAEPVSGQRGVFSSLIHRQLDSYPDTGLRVFYLALTVLATVTLYYELYVGGSVSTLILTNLHMTFTFYVVATAVGNLIGAFGSLLAGLTDRYGRANLVVFGLLFTGIFVAFIIPTATSKWPFIIYTFVVGLVEGICLVATPALIRDFSPQVGRATAMGFWTCGPVLGSLIVSVVGTNTIPVTPGPRFWTHEYVICGIAGIVVFLISFVFLRELSPRLRDQLMVTMRDRALIEAKAKGVDIESALRHPFRQLIKPDIVISSFAVSVMLLIYYAAVGFLVIYLTTVFGFSLKDANGLGNWEWGFNVVALIAIGLISDRFRVRKPFMVIGGVMGAIVLVFYLQQATHHPSYYTLAILLALLSVGLGIAYTPWMASFTESVEHRNPALIATGLAVWGWILRVVVFVSALLVPVVVHSVTPLVTYGTQVSTYAAQYPSLTWAGAHPKIVHAVQTWSTELNFAAAHPAVVADAQKDATQIADAQRLAPELAVIESHAALFAQAQQFPPNKIPAKLTQQLIAAAGGGTKGLQILGTISANQAAITSVIAVAPQLQQISQFSTQLKALATVPPSVIAAATANQAELAQLAKVPPAVSTFMAAHASDVVTAAANEPREWQHWYWVCFGGIIFFLLSVPLLRGRWRPRDARRDEDEHEAMVAAELAKLAPSDV
ncbi:MAG TPA: MFS transporter [Streptosporangiaceae bacterium]|jgi:MFS family permease